MGPMKYRRKEAFRFVFNEPVKASFAILLNGVPAGLKGTQYPCEIIDISPGGMKVYSDTNVVQNSAAHLHFEVHFVLDVTELVGVGRVVWSKTSGSGKQYGIQFNGEPGLGNLITCEMKQRRRKEVLCSN